MSGPQPAPPSMVLRPARIERLDRGNGVVTVPAGVPHRSRNRVHGGRDVTRTVTATGETVAHLSEADRRGTRESR